MIDTSEKDFEATVEAVLTGPQGQVGEELSPYGWSSVPGGFVRRRPEHYDRALSLDTEMLFGFILASQAQMWEKFKAQHGEHAKEQFLKRLEKEISSRGTLNVLRKGIAGYGCQFRLAFFKPETTLNDEHRRLYHANQFSVIRQVHYSQRNEKSLDLVLFLNGLPILTAELKNPLKDQTVRDATKQYQFDRDPKEPLLSFGRCLAHFAVDTDLIYMTAELHGNATKFLPFNKGHNNGVGNPPNPHGFKTSYLWEKVWQRDSLLEIINHYVQQVDILDEQGKKTGKQEMIFPRYHQLETVRRLVAHAKAYGTGNNYLIQHSAGSGKSNSIAWLCHQLAGLHDDQNERVFDCRDYGSSAPRSAVTAHRPQLRADEGAGDGGGNAEVQNPGDGVRNRQGHHRDDPANLPLCGNANRRISGEAVCGSD